MQKKSNFYITVALGFLVFIIMLVVVYLTIIKKNNVNKTTFTPKQVPTVETTKYKGYFELLPEKTEYKLGEQVVVKVLANSDNQSIAGFDLVVNYDPTTLKYMSNKVLDKDFQVISKNKISKDGKGVLKVTAYNMNIPTASGSGKIYDKTNVAELNFAPIKTSNTNMSLTFAKNQTNDTNLSSDQNEDVLTEVKSATIIIK